jgi:hypothetical protein
MVREISHCLEKHHWVEDLGFKLHLSPLQDMSEDPRRGKRERCCVEKESVGVQLTTISPAVPVTI